MYCLSFGLVKLVLAYSAEGTNPIIREVGERRTRLNPVFGVTDFRVIYPIAYFTYILVFIHNIAVS